LSFLDNQFRDRHITFYMIKLKKFNTSNITKKYINWLKDKEIIKFTKINPQNKYIDVVKYVKNINTTKKKNY